MRWKDVELAAMPHTGKAEYNSWIQQLRKFGWQVDDILPAGDLGFVNFKRKFLSFSIPELVDKMRLITKSSNDVRKRSGSELSLTDSQEELNTDLPHSLSDPGQKILDKIFKIRDKLVANEHSLNLNLKKRFGKRKRTVSFADDKGLPLENVKIVESAGTSDTRERLEDDLKVSPWIMAFYQPIFEKKKLKQTFAEKGVALETLDVEDTKMIGTMKVRNSSGKRKVFIRYTKDSWKTYTDIQAEPVPVDTDIARVRNNEAVYSFELDIPVFVLHIQFAVCVYNASGYHWDNNDDKNFIVLHHSCLDDQTSESDHDSDSDNTKL